MNISSRQIIIFAFLLFSKLINAQSIEIICKSDFISTSTDNDFSFIERTLDTTSLHFIARIKAIGKDNDTNIETLYKAIKDASHKLGANCFKFDDYKRQDSLNISMLVLDVYLGSDSLLNLNFLKHEKNVVYIFGSEKKSNKIYTFKLNNKKQIIKSGSFYKYQNKVGQEVKINKGGLFGATLWIKWRENKAATFLTLTGLGLSGATIQPPKYGTIGLTINTGRIYYLDGNLGHLLVLLLKQST